METNKAVVHYDSSLVTIEEMKKAVEAVGYGVSGFTQTTPKAPADSSNSSEKRENSSKKSVYQKYSVDDLKLKLEAKDFVLINVHVPYAGELPQTDLFIPFNRLEENADKLSEEKCQRIVLYCRSGNMSAVAAQKLLEMGYRNVYELTGGMNAWEQAGNKIINR